jgi:hypothetical protein
MIRDSNRPRVPQGSALVHPEGDARPPASGSIDMTITNPTALLAALIGAGLSLGCGDDSNRRANFHLNDDDSTFAGAEPVLAEGDEFAALSTNGAIKLGLTRDRVYFEVSQAVREHVDSTIETELDESDSRIARSIGGAVRRGIAGALDFEIDFQLEEVEDVEYRDGEIVFRFVDPGDERTLENIDIDDEPLTRSFAEDDARAFVAAFRRVKADGSF